jgi:hypothetical protein
MFFFFKKKITNFVKMPKMLMIFLIKSENKNKNKNALDLLKTIVGHQNFHFFILFYLFLKGAFFSILSKK